ncbi:MAG: peptidylprolyl isomerase [Phototrophicaceae bacterium]
MSKRSTTALPKKRKPEQPAGVDGLSTDTSLISQLRNQTVDEERLQRLILIGLGIIGGVIAVILLIAILWQTLVVPNQSVATVNGKAITVAQFDQRVRLERAVLIERLNLDLNRFSSLGIDPNNVIGQEPYSTWWSEIAPSASPDLLGSRVLDELIEEEIVRAKAAELGITADAAAVEKQVEEYFNFFRDELNVTPTETATPTITPTPFVSPTPSSTPSPTDEPSATPTPLEAAATQAGTPAATPRPTLTPRPSATPTHTPSPAELETGYTEDLNAFYTRARKEADLSREAVQSYFEYQALRAAISDSLSADLGTTVTYVNTRHILVTTEVEAQDIIASLNAGESFESLARAFSKDTGSGGRGGELGWSPTDNYVDPFRDWVVDAEIGVISPPIESEFGFHIIQVRAREEREATESDLQRAKARTLQTWLDEVTSEETNTIERGDNWVNHIPDVPVWDYRPDVTPTPVA